MSFRTLLPVALLPVSSLLALTFTSTAHAASQSGPVAKSEWTTSEVPSYIDMYLGLPDTLPEKPPIVVNIHSCGNNAGGQWGYDGFAPIRAAMDSVGFIMILPQQSRNCWNVGKPESLTHDGGGDTGAIIQMVKYALEKYNGDPTRVYVMGGSGGGMTTQALLATYPEIFKAGSERAGVAAGCWVEGYDDGEQWSTPCATGQVNKTAEEWGEFVRAINPDFTGPRPRVQMMHGNADQTININNLGESIEQWGNVLGLEETPTSTDSAFQGTAKVCNEGGCPSPVTYDRRFWQDACGFTVMEAWEAIGQKHGMGYESEAILQWFGLDEKRDQDPWDAECGGASMPVDGAGGAGGAGSDVDPVGTAGSGGTGTTSGPVGTGGAGTAEPAPNPSGSNTPVPVPGTSTTPATPPTPTAPAATASTPVAAPTTPVANPGTPGAPPPSMPVTNPVVPAANTGAPTASTGAPAASSSTTGLTPESDADEDSGGCSTSGRGAGSGIPFALLALGMLLRRRRSA